MNKSKLSKQVDILLEGLDSQEDVANVTQLIHERFLEKNLNIELNKRLSQEKSQSRRSYSKHRDYPFKTFHSKDSAAAIEATQNRGETLDSTVMKERLPALDSKITYLYSQGSSAREIIEIISNIYGEDISPVLVCRITDTVLSDVIEWLSRSLDDVYPIVYLDCIVVKVRQSSKIVNKAIYLALGISLTGHRELLGLWVSEDEEAKFWPGVLIELKNRGVEDILIVCVGCSVFPYAIHSVFPQAKVQLCVMHMVRYSMKYVSWKDYRIVASDLKAIYQSATEDEALQALEAFNNRWGCKYPQIAKSWHRHWDDFSILFSYPEDIRKIIYKANVIDSLNSLIRKAIKKRKLFLTEDSVKKLIYLVIQNTSKKWARPIRNWKLALNRFVIEFGNRLTDYL